MQNLFDILKNISHEKNKNLLEDGLDNYKPFIINRFISSERDCLFAASVLNEKRDIPLKAQYLFLFNVLAKRNRFFKFEKRLKNDSLDIIMEYYKCSYNIAKMYKEILSEEEIGTITKRMDRGGHK